MKIVTSRLSESFSEVELHVFSDWHIGDSNCDLQAIANELNAVLAKENAFVILNGDLMNNATKASVSDCYAEVIPPQKQIDLLYELLKPIKERILLITSGNHEDRTMRGDGIDLMACLSVRLGLEDVYCREGGLLFVKFGSGLGRTKRSHSKRPYTYTLYVTHGNGGGKRAGGKINRLEDLSNIVDADVYVHSHTHLPAIMKEDFIRTSPQNCTATQVTKLFVNTSSMLNFGGYGAKNGFRPSSTDSPVIYLTKDNAYAKL